MCVCTFQSDESVQALTLYATCAHACTSPRVFVLIVVLVLVVVVVVVVLNNSSIRSYLLPHLLWYCRPPYVRSLLCHMAECARVPHSTHREERPYEAASNSYGQRLHD